MNKVFLAVGAMIVWSPSQSADLVKIYFRSGSLCPLYTDFLVNGIAKHCQVNGQNQSDAACLTPATQLSWESKKKFLITNAPYTVSYSNNNKKATMDIPAGAPIGTYKYAISDLNNTCQLDPRIIVNPDRRLSEEVQAIVPCSSETDQTEE